MSGNIAENLAITPVFVSERVGSPTIFWNGQAVTTGAIMLDTAEYEEVEFVVNVGTKQGALATVLNSIYQSQTNDPTTASLLSGASFTTLGTSHAGDILQQGFVRCAGTNRYLALYTEVQEANSVPTVDLSALAIFGKSQSRPTGDVLDFDV